MRNDVTKIRQFECFLFDENKNSVVENVLAESEKAALQIIKRRYRNSDVTHIDTKN